MPDDVDIDYEYEKARAAARRGATAVAEPPRTRLGGGPPTARSSLPPVAADPVEAHRQQVLAALDEQDKTLVPAAPPEPERLTYDEARARFGVEKSPLADPLPATPGASTDSEEYQRREAAIRALGGALMQSERQFHQRRELAQEIEQTGGVDVPPAAPVKDDYSSIGAFAQAALNRARDIPGDLLKLPVRMGAMAAGQEPGIAVPEDLGGEIDDAIKRAVPIGNPVTGDERRTIEARMAAAHPEAVARGRQATDLAAFIAGSGALGPGKATAALFPVRSAALGFGAASAALDPEHPVEAGLSGAAQGTALGVAGPALERLQALLPGRAGLAVRSAAEGLILAQTPAVAPGGGLSWHGGDLAANAESAGLMILLGQAGGHTISPEYRRALIDGGYPPDALAKDEPAIAKAVEKALDPAAVAADSATAKMRDAVIAAGLSPEAADRYIAGDVTGLSEEQTAAAHVAAAPVLAEYKAAEEAMAAAHKPEAPPVTGPLAFDRAMEAGRALRERARGAVPPVDAPLERPSQEVPNAVPLGEAAPVPVGEAPGHRAAVDEGVRQQAAPEVGPQAAGEAGVSGVRAPRDATEIVAAINANVDAFYERKITEGQFHARQRELWDAASASPVVNEAVMSILRGEGPLPASPADLKPEPGSPADMRSKMRALPKAKPGKSLVEFVRQKGGINARTGNAGGEIERLARKGSGTTGLVRRDGGGLDAEDMMQSARESGYDVPADMGAGDFADRLYNEATGLHGASYSPETTDLEAMAEHDFRQRAEAEQARYEEWERQGMQAEPDAQDVTFDFGAEAEQHGVTPKEVSDVAERILAGDDPLAAAEAVSSGTPRGDGQEAGGSAQGEAVQAESVQPGDVVAGTTREGQPAEGTVVRATDKSLILDTPDGQVRVTKDSLKKPSEALRGVSQASIDAGLDVLRGRKPRATKTSPEAGVLDLPTAAGALAKVALSPKRLFDTAMDLGDAGVRGLVRGAARLPGVRQGVDAVKTAARVIADKISPYRLPMEYLSRLAEKEGQDALAKHDAKDKARLLANMPDGSPMTEAQQEVATRFLTGEATADDVKDAGGEEFAKILADLAAERDAKQHELRDMNVLSPETIAKWEGKYLTRMYSTIEAGKYAKDVPPNVAVGGKRIARVYQRKDISPMMREFLGEIRDPAVLVAHTRMRQDGMLATARFLKDVSENPNWVSDAPGDAYAKEPIPDEPRRYGALAGKYVHPRIRADIVAAFADRGGIGETIAHIADVALSQWKLGKTVFNPGTHGRNLIGNGVYAELEGESWLDPLNWQNGIDALKIVAAKPGSPLYDVKRALIAERIVGGDFLSTNVMDTAAEVAKMRGNTWLEKLKDYAESKAGKVKKGRILEALPGTDTAAALYQLEDVIPKVASYVSKVRGKSVLGMETRAPMEHSEAAAAVRDAYPTFDATAPGRWMRGRGIGGAAVRQLAPPFLSYTLAAAKTIAKQSLLHPVRAAALIGALKWLQYGMSDLDERKKRISEAASPAYRKPAVGAGFLPWKDSKGDLQLLDLRYAVPLGDESQSVLDWFREEKGVEDPGLRSMRPGGPFLSLAAQLLLNKDALTGKAIDSSRERGIAPNVSDAQGTRDTWKFIGQNLLPSIFPGGYSWNKISEALSGVPIDRRGLQTRDRTITFLDTLAGIKIRSVNLARDSASRLLEIDDILGGKLQRMKVIAAAKNISETDKRREHDELVADITRLYSLSLMVRGMKGLPAGATVDMAPNETDPEDIANPGRRLFREDVKAARDLLSPK